MNFFTKERIYSIIFWLSMAAILVWAVLKAYGIINTPVIVQIIPYVGAVFGAGVFYKAFLEMKKDVRLMKRDIHQLKLNNNKMETKLGYVDRDIGYLRNDIEVLRKALT